MLQDLPCEIVGYIGTFLTLKEVSNLSLSCKALNERVNSNVFFHQQYEKLSKNGWTSFYKSDNLKDNEWKKIVKDNEWKKIVKGMFPVGMKSCEKIMYITKHCMISEYLDFTEVTAGEIFVCIMNDFLVNYYGIVNATKTPHNYEKILVKVDLIFYLINNYKNDELYEQINYKLFTELFGCNHKATFGLLGKNVESLFSCWPKSDLNIEALFSGKYKTSNAKKLMKALMDKYGEMCLNRLGKMDIVKKYKV
jgi:hypothetical protein